MMNVLRSASVRLGLLAVLLVGVAVWLAAAGAPSSSELQHAVREAGWLAPVAFVAIYIGWTVLVLPGVVPTLAGGALFGVAAGSALSLLGALVGATLAFLIGRRLGRAQVEALAGRRMVRLDAWMHRRGFLALLYARLVPVIPFNLLNYAAGLMGLSTRSYVVASALGIVPGTIAYTALGSAAAHPGSTPFLVSLTAIAILTVVAGALSHRGQRSLAGR